MSKSNINIDWYWYNIAETEVCMFPSWSFFHHFSLNIDSVCRWVLFVSMRISCISYTTFTRRKKRVDSFFIYFLIIISMFQRYSVGHLHNGFSMSKKQIESTKEEESLFPLFPPQRPQCVCSTDQSSWPDGPRSRCIIRAPLAGHPNLPPTGWTVLSITYALGYCPSASNCITVVFFSFFSFSFWKIYLSDF